MSRAERYPAEEVTAYGVIPHAPPQAMYLRRLRMASGIEWVEIVLGSVVVVVDAGELEEAVLKIAGATPKPMGV